MEVVYLIIFFLIGTIFGSFYGVVGTRLSEEKSILTPGSHCESCEHPLKWYDLIPVLSYFLQKGKCRYCQEKISIVYPFIELVTGLLFALSYYSFRFTPSCGIALVIVSLLIVILVSDLNYYIIPDEVLVVSSILLIILQYFEVGLQNTLFYILNGVFLFGIMYLIMLLGNRLFKRESLGGGDIKLMFVIGLVLHPILGILSIFLASVIALPVSLIILKKNEDHIIPFGPFLVLAMAFLYFAKVDPTILLRFYGF